MKTPKRPVGLMTLAQGICLLVTAVILFIFLIPMIASILYAATADYANHDNTLMVAIMDFVLVMPDTAIGILLAYVGIEAFLLCGRVKKASAFSAKNEKHLGRIAIILCVAGCLSLLFDNSIFPWLLADLPAVSPIVERLLLPFILLTLALMIRAVQVLMRRALDMQEESDLTV